MWWGTPKIDCFDACPAFCSFKPRLPRPGLTLSTIPEPTGQVLVRAVVSARRAFSTPANCPIR